jgi:hypothetical protein
MRRKRKAWDCLRQRGLDQSKPQPKADRLKPVLLEATSPSERLDNRRGS